MTRKLKYKIIIDVLMTMLLPILMAYMLTGQAVHEWAGMLMFLLFIAHNVLNIKWYRNIFLGKYSIYRVLKIMINLLIFLAMIGLMISGMMMSRYVFSFLSIKHGMDFARKLHMVSAYWGFVIMSLHLGMHGKMMGRLANKALGVEMLHGQVKTVPSILFTLISLYGLYAFFKNDIASYMFLKNMFVFFDHEQSLSVFFIEYLSMMVLFGCFGHYFTFLLPGHVIKNKFDKKREREIQ